MISHGYFRHSTFPYVPDGDVNLTIARTGSSVAIAPSPCGLGAYDGRVCGCGASHPRPNRSLSLMTSHTRHPSYDPVLHKTKLVDLIMSHRIFVS